MMVHVPTWLESSYLELYDCKRICYGGYEEVLWQEENEIVFIKNMSKDYLPYAHIPNIIVIFNSPKPNADTITVDYLVKQLCDKFNYPYDKKIVKYCEKHEISPFITILNLSLGGELPLPEEKEIIPLGSTISTSKYLQASLWFYFLGKKFHKVFGTYSPEKCLYLFNSVNSLEEDFGYRSEDLAHVFLLPILYFH